MPFNHAQGSLIPMPVRRIGFHLGVVRSIIVRQGRPIRALPVVPIVKIQGDSSLDPNHFADVQKGPVIEMDTGLDTPLDVSEPIKRILRLDLYDGSGFCQETRNGEEVIVDRSQTLTAFGWSKLLRSSL